MEPIQQQNQGTQLVNQASGFQNYVAIPGGQMPVAKKSKKKWIFGGIGALLLISGIGGGAYAYRMLKSPEKVLLNAYQNMTESDRVSFKGDINVFGPSLGGNNFKINFSGGGDQNGYQMDGSLNVAILDLSGSVQLYPGDSSAFVRLNSLNAIIDLAATAGLEIPEEIEAKLRSANGKWIKIDQTELEKLGLVQDQNAGLDKCTRALQSITNNNPNFNKQIIQALKENSFVEIINKDNIPTETVEGRTALKMVLGLNENKAKEFADEIKKQKIFTDLEAVLKNDCANGESAAQDTLNGVDTEVVPDLNEYVVTLWVDKANNNPVKILMEVKAEDGLSFALDSTVDITKAFPVVKPAANQIMGASEFKSILDQFSNSELDSSSDSIDNLILSDPDNINSDAEGEGLEAF